ncbi:MAG: CHAT domain-containing protein [Ornithinibacter sp.]
MLASARADNEVGRYEAAAERLDAALVALNATPGPQARQLATRVRITQAWTEMELRGMTSALELLLTARLQAEETSDPLLLALTHIQEANIRGRCGDWRGAIDAGARVGAAEEFLNPSQRCALHINMGLASLALGDSEPASAALEEARDIAVDQGLLDQEFKARHNLACLAFVDGDLPRALLLMREADVMDAAVSRDRARLDHAEVLIEAGLVNDARTALGEALASAQLHGHRLEEGAISLRLARCDLLVGDLAGARSAIRSAIAAYRTRQAPELVREAELVRSTIDVAEGNDLASVVTTLAHRNDRAPGSGPTHRESIRLEAEARLLLGDADGAERRLSTLHQGSHETLGAMLHETLVRARLDEARGRDGACSARLLSGNRVLAAHQFQSSSLDVRAALALHGRKLAAYDVQRALGAGDVSELVTTVERWRAISHRINPVTTSTDPELAAATRELRRLRRLLADSDGDSARELSTGVAALESQVAQREWGLTVEGSGAGRVHPVAAEEALSAVGAADATVVEFFESDGDLWGIILCAARLDVTRLGPVHEIAEGLVRLRRDLRARAIIAPGAAMASVLDRAVRSSLDAVDRALNPEGTTAGRVVVVPSRSLAGVPWSLMPSLLGRPVTVAPSLTRWVRGPARAVEPVAQVAATALYGPGLSRTEPEIRAIRAAWLDEGDPAAAVTGPADSEEVLRALSSSRVVHLAAHGVHEGQSPLFSSVQMADGPVFAHEFPRPVAAEHVALAACDVGQFSTRAGDEPLGLAIALMSLGARSVLAAVAPVADDLAAEAMVGYHRRLATGEDAASAWAAVVAEEPAAGVFCLYGSDWSAGD